MYGNQREPARGYANIGMHGASKLSSGRQVLAGISKVSLQVSGKMYGSQRRRPLEPVKRPDPKSGAFCVAGENSPGICVSDPSH